jgi:hypothetical protein
MRPPRTQQHTARVRTEGEAILDSPPLAAYTVYPAACGVHHAAGGLACSSPVLVKEHTPKPRGSDVCLNTKGIEALLPEEPEPPSRQQRQAYQQTAFLTTTPSNYQLSEG